MIRILVITDAAILALLGAASLASGAPFGSVALAFLAAELGGAVVIALARIPRTLRRMHPPREVQRPVERVTAEVVTWKPVSGEPTYRVETRYGHAYTNLPSMIEAPSKEVVKWNPSR